MLSEGSELLLEVLNPGIIGGVVLPVLGALPDSLIILTSLSAPAAEAQEQVAVGIGEPNHKGHTHCWRMPDSSTDRLTAHTDSSAATICTEGVHVTLHLRY